MGEGKRSTENSLNGRFPFLFKFGITLIFAIILGGVLLFIFGIIALPIKLVLMLFYPIGEPSAPPTQTAAHYWTLSLEVLRWEAYLAAGVLIVSFFVGSIAVASAFLSKGVAKSSYPITTQTAHK